MARKSPDHNKMSTIEVGELTSLAMTLALCVLIGYGGGKWIGGKFDHETTGILVGLGVGIAAATLEITRVIKRFYGSTSHKRAKDEGSSDVDKRNPDNG
ncbi:MAG: AtpZ/AtpI family protein [Candidatus Poribacteria bacterium]|nr:AtpZ/AtpI family protein [Candidatus Poribacteria bacterium]